MPENDETIEPTDGAPEETATPSQPEDAAPADDASEENAGSPAESEASDGPASYALPSLDGVSGAGSANDLSMLSDVNLHVKIELGRTQMLVEDVLCLNSGSVIELDKLAGDPVDIYVNGRAVARGEVLVLNDNFCVRVSEILEQVMPNAG